MNQHFLGLWRSFVKKAQNYLRSTEIKVAEGEDVRF